jgi:hypothetical protein
MAPNVIKLTVDDMVTLAAYAASLPPAPKLSCSRHVIRILTHGL